MKNKFISTYIKVEIEIFSETTRPINLGFFLIERVHIAYQVLGINFMPKNSNFEESIQILL